MHGHRESGPRTANAHNPLLLRSAPDAFSSIICSKLPSAISAAERFQNHAQALWTTFRQRVHPLFKLLFNWELDQLESATITPGRSMQLDDAQDALVSAVYLASVVSLSGAECETKLQQSKVTLLSELQNICEGALAKTNILRMKNIVSLKALALYIVSSSCYHSE